jgi:D-alanyl-D-alanine carboxypeptidase
MTQTNYVNPNGLPDDRQVTSARDLAILARALIKEFPEHEMYWHLSGIKFGRRLMRNHNSLIGRYQGADGMKTGFICASGFNVVASASRNGRRLIAVVLGAPSSNVRAAKAAHMLERGFNSGTGLSFLTPSLGSVESLVPVEAEPPNMREEMCGKKRRRPAAEEDDLDTPAASASVDSGSPHQARFSSLRPSGAKTSDLLGPWVDVMPAVVVYTGPKRDNVPEFAVAEAPKRVKPKPAAEAKAGSAVSRGRAAAGGATSRASFTPPASAAASPSPSLSIATNEPGEARPHKKRPRVAARPKPQTATINVAAEPKPAVTPKRAAAKPLAASKPVAAPKPAGGPKPAAAAPAAAPRTAAPKPQAPKPHAAAKPAHAPRTAAVPRPLEQ